MTDEIEAMAKRLEAYAKDQGGWHNIDETCAEAAAALRRLAGETFHRHSAHVAAEEERGAWKARATAAEARLAKTKEALRLAVATFEDMGFSPKDVVLVRARAALAAMEAGDGK